MGLIDEGVAPTPTPDAQATPVPAPDTGGDLIAKTRTAFEQKVPADQQDALQRIILAGKKILYDKTTNTEVEDRIKNSPNPASAAGKGALELLGVLMQESRGTLPKNLVPAAAGVLMTEILDYLKQTNRIKGSVEDIETATRDMSNTLMKASGVTPETFDQILNKTSESLNDPKIAAQLQQHMQGA